MAPMASEDMKRFFWSLHEEMLRDLKKNPNPGQKQEAKVTSQPELPKQDLLAKLLAMTTSSNDSEALVAIRKANLLMASAGWTWPMLISNKIKVVENPFANLGDPRADKKPQPQATPRPQPRTLAQPPVNSRTTTYSDDWCYCCGIKIKAGAGWVFNPNNFNRYAPPNSYAICDICNSNPSVYIGEFPAAHQRPPITSRVNQFPGFCYSCGKPVPSLTGFIFKPFDFNRAARNLWSTLCAGCNTPTAIIADSPAKHAKTYKPDVKDL